ncbi:MAG: hypothetical protein E7649_06165 [Ruminococcaceae bacterium]|nr:hypothetical protein [Oscillospiraceae bacterium]
MKNNRLPDSVYKLVIAEFVDYDRKRKLLDSVGERKATNELVRVYLDRVIAIDAALLAVCRGEGEEAREALRSDIAQGRGFKTSAAKKYYTAEQIYKRRKSDVIYEVAKAMKLI